MFDINEEEHLGMHEVEFRDGGIRRIRVKQHVIDGNGHPIYIEDVTGRLFNYQNIVSIRKDGSAAGETTDRR